MRGCDLKVERPSRRRLLVTDSSVRCFGSYLQASQVLHCPHEPYVDRCAVYTALIFGHAAPDLCPPTPHPYTMKDVWCWRGVVPTLGLDQRDLSEGGSCKWRMMGAGGGVTRCEKRSAARPELVSSALPLSPQTRCLHRTDGGVLLALAPLHRTCRNTHTDVIMTTFWKPARVHVCTQGKKKQRVTWKEKLKSGNIKGL